MKSKTSWVQVNKCRFIAISLKLLAYVRSSTLFKTAAGSFGLKIGSAALIFTSGIILARLLGPREFGIYSIAVAALNLTATLAALGLPSLVVREVAKYEAKEQWGRLRGIIRTSNHWVVVASGAVLFMGVVLGASGWVLPSLPLLVYLISLLTIPLIALNQLRAAILRGLHWVILADIPDLFLRPLVMLLLVGGSYAYMKHASAIDALIMQLFAVVVAFLVGAWFLRTHMPMETAYAEARIHSRTWFYQTLPFFLISVISLLEGQLGLYLLGYLAGPEQVGLFQAANQLVSMAVIGLIAVNLPLQPKIAAAWARGDKEHVQRMVTEASRIGVVVAFATSTVLIVFAEAIVHLYGSQYVGAANVLRILVVGQFFNALAGPCGLLLAATGHQRLVLYGISFALIVNFIVNVFLVPKYGATGTALATIAGLIVWNGILAYWSRRELHINTFAIAINR